MLATPPSRGGPPRSSAWASDPEAPRAAGPRSATSAAVGARQRGGPAARAHGSAASTGRPGAFSRSVRWPNTGSACNSYSSPGVMRSDSSSTSWSIPSSACTRNRKWVSSSRVYDSLQSTWKRRGAASSRRVPIGQRTSWRAWASIHVVVRPCGRQGLACCGIVGCHRGSQAGTQQHAGRPFEHAQRLLVAAAANVLHDDDRVRPECAERSRTRGSSSGLTYVVV